MCKRKGAIMRFPGTKEAGSLYPKALDADLFVEQKIWVAENDVNQDDHLQARFQRTDQWKLVYTWLETLEDTEVVKSNDIADWLSANPDVRDDLYSRHSRYHLMHYIKKWHVKILKRKERKKGLPITKANKKIMSKSEGK
ncbi:RING finger protein [Heracleum sosnowskyi]|uniref:RING finger protein n=1 Tax=Heracleum sosnowskyi TaxID=360622 RepID=A0AAD8MXV6_9APIA|nr:RING finger protein [Heracleum sosnowskyi]